MYISNYYKYFIKLKVNISSNFENPKNEKFERTIIMIQENRD